MRGKILLSNTNQISTIDNRIYSSFIEQMGRAVYTGIYEPGHPTADGQGFRQDVMELIAPLHLSCIRYPGGNMLSGYRWQDGIGPKDTRPVRPELAWFSLETNQVGTDEFLQWCERLGIQPMLGVNLGTGTPQDAVDLLEYVNGSLSTHFADLRRRNGHEAPYNVKLWCLGNEMDGPWQICAKTAEEYSRIACETAKMMKWMDPSIELVACGSSYRDMPTFGTWEQTVLKHCYPYIEYLSLHQYYENAAGDVPTFLARSLEMESSIQYIAKLCRQAREAQNGDHDVMLSFDEWNVWYHFKKEGKEPPKWTAARPIEEERYDDIDTLVVGCMLNTLLRNADTVKIACMAQLVNVIAPIMTEPGGKAWVQGIYYPLLYASQYGRGVSLRPQVEVERYACAIAEQVPYLDCSATQDSDGNVSMFLVNRSQDESIDVTAELAGFAGLTSAVHLTLEGCQTKELPCEITAQGVSFRLPPLSWNMVRVVKV